MKKLKFLIIISACIFTFEIIGQEDPTEFIEKSKDKQFIGQITRDVLTKEPFNIWFSKNYNDYIPDKIILKRIKKNIEKYTIVVFIGTWCSDSQRDIPKFYKILDNIGLNDKDVKIFGLDRNKNSIEGQEKGLQIKYVPTFIFYKRGKEVGRITEIPKKTLEEDILAIIK